MQGVVTRFNRWIKKEHQAAWSDDVFDSIDLVAARGRHTFLDNRSKNISTFKCNSYGTIGVFLGDSLLFRVWRKGGCLQHNFLTYCKHAPNVSSYMVGIAESDIVGLKYTSKTATTDRIVKDDETGATDYYMEEETTSVFSRFSGTGAVAYFDKYLIRPEQADGKRLSFEFTIRGPANKTLRRKYAFSPWVTYHFDTESIQFVASFTADGSSFDSNIAVSFVADAGKVNRFEITKIPEVRETED